MMRLTECELFEISAYFLLVAVEAIQHELKIVNGLKWQGGQ